MTWYDNVLPGVKNTLQSTKIAGDDGTISAIVTKRILGKEKRCHPRQQQDSRPLPKTPPDTPCIFFCVVRARAAHIIHRTWSDKSRRFC